MSEIKIADESFFDRTEVVQLPSMVGTDVFAEIRRPDLIDLVFASNGDAPDFLTQLVLNQLNGKKTDKVEVRITRETLPELVEVVNSVAIASLVRPRLRRDDEVDPTRISVRRLSFADRLFVFNKVIGSGEYAAAKSFRDGEPDAGAEPVPDGGELRDAT